MNTLQTVDYADPHRTRTRELLRRHPELKKLVGPTWATPPLAVALVLVQLAIAVAIADAAWWWILLAAFGVGAFIALALYAVLHECAHLVAGRGRTVNRVVSLIANLPLVVPVAITYAHFHLLHHRHQGDPDLDPDLPSPVEHRLAKGGSLGKLVWQALFPFFQFSRTSGKPEPRARGWVWANGALQLAFVGALAWLVGFGAVAYLLLSFYFTMALHPIAMRLIQEHHVVHEQQETYSYYGWVNAIALNVGYHNEHHDFPAVPWTRMRAVRRIGREMYEQTLVSHSSYTRLWMRFFTDGSLGPRSRVVRTSGAEEHSPRAR